MIMIARKYTVAPIFWKRVTVIAYLRTGIVRMQVVIHFEVPIPLMKYLNICIETIEHILKESSLIKPTFLLLGLGTSPKND